MMLGFLSTENVADRSNRLLAGEQWRMLLATGAVGVLAGLFMAHVRLHLGLPGHKALFWMIPVIAARLAFRSPAGATIGALAASFTTLGIGGHLAGGLAHLPLVGLAGIMLDVTIGLAERRALAVGWMIPLLGCAGLLANLVCFLKRVFPPSSFKLHVFWGYSGPWGSLVSYAFFGLLAGLIGATLGCILLRRKRTRA
ncbi:MAG: hypothetical protein WBE26_13330 [Phycisphaerae bacterium]